MSEHLPECPWAPHDCDEDMCERCDRGCFCNELRACEDRVRTSDFYSAISGEHFKRGHAAGLNAAREAVSALPEYQMRDTCVFVIDALREEKK